MITPAVAMRMVVVMLVFVVTACASVASREAVQYARKDTTDYSALAKGVQSVQNHK